MKLAGFHYTLHGWLYPVGLESQELVDMITPATRSGCCSNECSNCSQKSQVTQFSWSLLTKLSPFNCLCSDYATWSDCTARRDKQNYRLKLRQKFSIEKRSEYPHQGISDSTW